jgi:hypothetical protein
MLIEAFPASVDTYLKVPAKPFQMQAPVADYTEEMLHTALPQTKLCCSIAVSLECHAVGAHASS